MSRWQQALQGSQLPPLHVLSQVLRGLPWRRSLQLLQRSAAARLSVDVVCFGSLMSALERSAQWRQSLEALRSLEKRGLEANAVVLTAAFRALGRANRWQEAQALAHRATLDGVARTALAFTYEQSSLWQEAVYLTVDLKSPAALGVQLAAYEKALAWPEALQLALKLSGGHVKPISEPISVGLKGNGINGMMANSLLSTFGRSLKWKIALQLLGHSESSDVDV